MFSFGFLCRKIAMLGQSLLMNLHESFFSIGCKRKLQTERLRETTIILSLLTTSGSSDKPNLQDKIYLIGNSTLRQCSPKETLTVCIEAPQGSFSEKIKYFEIVMGHLWFLSETVGRVDLHRKYLKAVVLGKTLQPLHPSRTNRKQKCFTLQLH